MNRRTYENEIESQEHVHLPVLRHSIVVKTSDVLYLGCKPTIISAEFGRMQAEQKSVPEQFAKSNLQKFGAQSPPRPHRNWSDIRLGIFADSSEVVTRSSLIPKPSSCHRPSPSMASPGVNVSNLLDEPFRTGPVLMQSSGRLRDGLRSRSASSTAYTTKRVSDHNNAPRTTSGNSTRRSP